MWRIYSNPDPHGTTVGGVSCTNDVPYIEYVLSFLKNDSVQQPVISPNINENQNP
jgi:hypothetical protein